MLDNRGGQGMVQESEGHAIGRCRGGLSSQTSKLHAAVDGNGVPRVIVLTSGQRHDGAILAEALGDFRMSRIGAGSPRTRFDGVVGDRAYPNELTVRQRKCSKGGHPMAFEPHTHKACTVVERCFGLAKQWRAVVACYNKLAITCRVTAVLGAIVAWFRK